MAFVCVARVTERGSARGRARDGVCAPIPPLHSEAAAVEECFCRSERQTERGGGKKRGLEERAEQAQAGEGGGGNVALVVSFAARLLPPPPALEKPVCFLRSSKWFINIKEGNNSTVSLTSVVYSVLTSR